MKLIDAAIENYMCLKKVSIKFGGLTILVGKNGSGKTSILEALYRVFNDFATVGGGISSGATDYLWHDRDTSYPILIRVNLALNKEEYEKLFPQSSKALGDNIIQRYGDKHSLVSFARRITAPGGSWQTSELTLGGITLVKDDKPIDLPEFSKLTANKNADRFILHYFTPQKEGGDRLLVDDEKKVAYMSAPNIDNLVASRGLRTSSEFVGQKYVEWASTNGFTLVQRPPDSSEAPFLQSITAEVLNSLMANITTAIHGKFRFIPAARDNKTPLANIRTPIVEQTILNSISALAVSGQRSDEIKWNRFRNWQDKFLGKSIENITTGLVVRDQDLRVPVYLSAGGEQSLFGLLWNLIDAEFIVAIEEPENHFHPEYVRKLLKFFKEFVLENDAQIIICTHSASLIDKLEVSNNWVIRRKGKQSSAQQLKARGDLKFVLAELGVLPSDVYLKDLVLFLEGGTEKEAVWPAFAKKAGFALEENVAIISIGGDSKLKEYLRVWLNLIEYANLNFLVVLDQHSKNLVYELVREFHIDIQLFHVLSKHCMEDYYPDVLILEALKAVFGVSTEEKSFSVPKDKAIERILNKNKVLQDRWKIHLGLYIAEKMDEVPDEIKTILEEIKGKLGTK